jgi:hypothetical protein
MALPIKATHQQTRVHNERLVVRTLYDLGPISRAEVARLTGLTRTTVHHGCCVQVLGHDLLRQGDRYALVLDVGLTRTQFVVERSVVANAGWVAYLSTARNFVAGAAGRTEREAAEGLDRQLRGLERLAAAAMGGNP